ncbi:hypothetical protein K1F50_13535 [Muricauda oceani]|uniref:hypothetical protein n=1 Tax=Flagellimonas oceani TaxID=2698672 RepID=UPI001C67C6AE|nr:hypothetical protein [Allomuricauda oceani]MBW8243824.1 hypothetical protein [Allomuricauda oceani]
MKKSILALLFLLFTGIAFSQTTVTLQDQCNCEVLKGTDVSNPGATSPSGADLGDIYVNTNTGTIYFWDGDSWELTSTDDQQLTGFNFDDVTNILSLSLENGGNVNVDLSSLKDIFTDSNTAVTSFDIDGTNTNLVITDSDANTFSVALADLAALIDTNTDSQDLSLSGDALSLTGDPTATPIDLGAYTETVTGANDLTVTADGSGNYTGDYADGDKDDTNELSDLSLDGSNVLTLSNPATGGNSVDLSGLLGTDSQDLSLSGDELSLTGDPTATPIDLSGYLDNTDNQDASEVDSDTPVDVDGDGNTEATVEDVIQDIAPIISKAARIFYPPSIAIDASSNGTGRTLNLYSQYVAQYGSPAVASAGAPAAIPTYGPTELYYYITYADPTVFDNMVIDANGVLTYDIIGQPADYNALINVVFVVK